MPSAAPSPRRAQITNAMITLLARDGVGGATMRALAAETGLTQGVLHYHYAAKEDMVLAALAAIEARLDARLQRVAAADPLDTLVDALLAPQDADPATTEALAAWVSIGDAAQTEPGIRRAWGDALGRLHAAFRSRILLRAPRLDPGQADALAAAAVSQVEGAWRIGRIAPWAMPPGVAASTLRVLLAAALGAGAGPFPSATAAAPPPPAVPRRVALGVRLRPQDRRWFDALVAASPLALPDAVWSAVAAAYTAPDRHYHSLEHLAELARWWREVAVGLGWTDPRSAWLALLFHDAVQARTGPPGEDESRSAALLAALLPDTEAAEQLIRLTASHGARPDTLGGDAALFLDCDVAILGAAPARFARYERQIAAEYAPLVPAELYRAGRRAFLERLARQPRIFASDWFHQRLDARARANLATALGADAGPADGHRGTLSP